MNHINATSSVEPVSADTHKQARMQAVRSLLERSGLVCEDLIHRLSLDAHQRMVQVRVELQQIDPDKAQGRGRADDLAGIKPHVNFALRKEPSRRWLPALRQRVEAARQSARADLAQSISAWLRQPQTPSAQLLAELLRQLDEEIQLARRRIAEQQAALGRIETQLRPVQTEIEAVFQPPPASSFLGKLRDLALATLTQGINVVTHVINAERLVNDREEYAFLHDVAQACANVLQEALAVTQQAHTQLAGIGQAVSSAQMLGEAAFERAHTGLQAHPYAQVDVTSVRQSVQLAHRHTLRLLDDDLGTYIGMSGQALFDQIYADAHEQVHARVATLSLTDLVELYDISTTSSSSSSSPAAVKSTAHISAGDSDQQRAGADLVMDALQLATERAGAPTLALRNGSGQNAPQDWWLVGVADATNPGFHFGNSLLVSTQRPHQLQFLHVQTNLSLAQLEDFGVGDALFERALQERNYFVMDALLGDNDAYAAFGIGLACGLVMVQQGQFALKLPGHAPQPLSHTPEEALTALLQQPDRVQALLSAIDTLPLNELARQLQRYLVLHPQPASAIEQECVTQVRQRLHVVEQQRRLVDAGATADPNGSSDTSGPQDPQDRQ